MHFCVPNFDASKLECRPIPVLIVKYPPDPGPDPPFFARIGEAIRVLFAPRERWAAGNLAGSGLTDQTVKDLRILATIESMTEQLSPNVRSTITQATESAAKGLPLPRGGRLNIAA